MIFVDKRIPASGPKTARLAVIGMAPAKWEFAAGKPFVGISGRLLDEALSTAKVHRSQTYVTNLVEFYVDDNDLFSIPKEIMDSELQRVWKELDTVRPNCLLILGGDTLHFLAGKQGIQKWRGSIFEIETPSGRRQKCVAAMHPASFVRGQWKWLPVFKYIDVPRAVIQSSFPEMKLATREAIVGPSFQTAVDFLREASTKEWVSIDYEGQSHITCLGVGWTADQALCIPMNRVGQSSYWTLEQEVILWRLWCQLLQNRKVKKIAQNAAFEWIKSWQVGIYPNPLGIDTMLAHHCLYPDFGGVTDEWTAQRRNPDNPGHGLAFITSQYTDQPFYKDDGRHWRPEHGEHAFWRYNALDVMVTCESAMKLIDELKANKLWDVYQRNYNDKLLHALRMEWQGVAIDVARRDSARIEMLTQLDTLKIQLEAKIGQRVVVKAEHKGKQPKGVLNLSSPKQMQAFLTEQGYKIRRHPKTGKPTVDKDTLTALAVKHADSALSTIMEMRKLQDLMSDVIDQELDHENRIHCHFKIGGTNGTRWSSTESILGSGTNLQNLPRQGVARSLFLPS